MLTIGNPNIQNMQKIDSVLLRIKIELKTLTESFATSTLYLNVRSSTPQSNTGSTKLRDPKNELTGSNPPRRYFQRGPEASNPTGTANFAPEQ